MGWDSLLEGWQDSSWEETQQNYYSFLKSWHTGRRWAVSLIKKLWTVAWDLWEHRNRILHQKDSATSRIEKDTLDQKLRQAYYNSGDKLQQHDKYLTSLSLTPLLAKDITYKRTWLSQINLAMKSFKNQR
jgi:hypothetical protein